MVSNLSEPHFPEVDEEIEEVGDNWYSSHVPNGVSDTMKTEGDTTMSPDRSFSSVSTASGSSTVEPINEADVDSPPILISNIDSNDGGTYQASAIASDFRCLLQPLEDGSLPASGSSTTFNVTNATQAWYPGAFDSRKSPNFPVPDTVTRHVS
jgi:hypothetical protein